MLASLQAPHCGSQASLVVAGSVGVDMELCVRRGDGQTSSSPAWCSLPPLLGPFQHRPHASALLLGTRAPTHRTNTEHYEASLMTYESYLHTSTTFANIGNLSSHNIGKPRYSHC